MKKYTLTLSLLILFSLFAKAQNAATVSPCSHTEIVKRHLADNPNAEAEMAENEAFTKLFIEQLKLQNNKNRGATYTIPVVLHVFHDGNDGKLDMAQLQSGLSILNADFNGQNSDWNTIDPRFDSIKASIDIQFCLATIDPNGNPTTGVNYYDDPQMMLNNGNLFQYAWDNYKYLNIYLPKYTKGAPSLFTAHAYYPSLSRTNSNTDGIFYSSIRWGYGSNSELVPGQEWASVVTHETGHWLNLRHTFENGCNSPGDGVGDTPPTTGGTIELIGCKNNDSTCGVPTNGENYMDYNHDCKKMFTQGQVNRMLAALQVTARKNLWTDSNLIATGCKINVGVQQIHRAPAIGVYPNPSSNFINFTFDKIPQHFVVYDVNGQLIMDAAVTNTVYQLDVSRLPSGIYFYHATYADAVSRGKFVKEK